MAGRPKGYPKSGGRKPGTPNKVTAEVQTLAREYTERAIRTLADIMENDDNSASRVAAADKLLDRGWGRAKQPLTGEGDKPLFPAITVQFGADGSDVN